MGDFSWLVVRLSEDHVWGDCFVFFSLRSCPFASSPLSLRQSWQLLAPSHIMSSNMPFLNALLNSTMATNASANTTKVTFLRSVDLGGDTNIVAGVAGCQVRLRVSKALLSFASTYFSALFRHNFKEGGIAVQGGDIVLEEDEPDALVNLCKILHMQYTAPRPMSPTELLHLAIVADKYGCV